MIRILQHSLKTDSKFSPGETVLETSTQTFPVCVVKAHNGNVVMKVHENCFAGEWKDSSLRVRVSTAVGVPTTNYSDSHLHSISADKMANKFTMYERFISHDRRPDYLPPPTVVSSTSSTAQTSAQTSSSSSASTTAGQRENRASAQQKAAMDWDTKNEQDGLKVTQQKQDVLGVSKSFLTCWSYLMLLNIISHHYLLYLPLF